MNNSKYISNSAFLIICFILLLGCSEKKKQNKYFEVVNRRDKTMEVKLFDDQSYTLPINPKKTIILYNSLIEPWCQTGGNCIGRVSSHIPMVEWVKNINVVGRLGSPNIELIVEMKPDLVIFADNIKGQNRVKKFLKNNKIPILPIKYNNYYDFQEILKLFSLINNSEDSTQVLINDLQQRVNQTISKVKRNENKSALILFASTKNISCELPVGDTGTLLQLLGINNVVKDSPFENSRRVEVSLEKILELNPDIIFVKTMGDIKKIEKRIGKELIENNAWARLKAVRNKSVYYLPKELFMYKANYKYPEALEYLAEKVNND